MALQTVPYHGSAKQSHSRRIPGTLRLDMCKAPSGPHQRKRYTPDRRNEVNAMRKLGACLRCRLRKKPCSGGVPCKLCSEPPTKRCASGLLTWMPCVRPSIVKDLETNFPRETLDFVLRSRSEDILDLFFDEITEQDFFIPEQWDRIGVTSYSGEWEFAIDHKRCDSQRIGVITTTGLYEMVTKYLSPGLAGLAKFYVRGCTILYDMRCGQFIDAAINQTRLEELLRCASILVLQEVDALLHPKKLAACSPGSLNCLFLCLMLIARSLDFMLFDPRMLTDEDFQARHGKISASLRRTLSRFTSIYALTLGERLGFFDSDDGSAILETLENTMWAGHTYSYQIDTRPPALKAPQIIPNIPNIDPLQSKQAASYLNVSTGDGGFPSVPALPHPHSHTSHSTQVYTMDYFGGPEVMQVGHGRIQELYSDSCIPDTVPITSFATSQVLDVTAAWNPALNPTILPCEPDRLLNLLGNDDWLQLEQQVQDTWGHGAHSVDYSHSHTPLSDQPIALDRSQEGYRTVRVANRSGVNLKVRYNCPVPECNLQFSSMSDLKFHKASEHRNFSFDNVPAIGPQPLEPTPPVKYLDCSHPGCFRKGEYGFIQHILREEHEWLEHQEGSEGRAEQVRKALSLFIFD